MSPDKIMPRVHAVVVTYIPEIKGLRDLLFELVPQVECVHVVDNTPQSDARVPDVLQELQMENVRLQRLGENLGIARALNEGIKAAFAAGATHVVLSDQDSLPASNMVGELLRAERALRLRGVRLGAVGPTFTDAHTGTTFPFQVDRRGRLFYGNVRTRADNPLVEALSLISSGCLIPAEAWTAVGPMREDFFIDYVDIEWSHRARARGYHLYGTAWATMAHHLGDAQIKIWYFGWRHQSAYNPLRVYYRVRNFTTLCKSPLIPAYWKLYKGFRIIGFVCIQVIFGHYHKPTSLMALRGLSDGLRGRMGRWHE